MTIQSQVDEAIKTAMKARDADRLAVLRMLKSAMKNLAIEKHGAEGQLEDSDALAVIRKQVKQREDSIESFERGGRPELAAKERTEIVVLAEYLPQPLSKEEIGTLVAGAIAEVSAVGRAQMGAVMKIVTAAAAGRADGKMLSQEVQRQLA